MESKNSFVSKREPLLVISSSGYLSYILGESVEATFLSLFANDIDVEGKSIPIRRLKAITSNSNKVSQNDIIIHCFLNLEVSI